MGSSQLRTLVVAVTAAILVVAGYAPEANADRRSALGGNLLIQDQDDVFVFPHTAGQYVRTLSLDLGLGGDAGQLGGANRPAPGGAAPGTSNYGSAGIILGDDALAFGLFAHRGDIVNNLPFAATGFGDVEMLGATGGGGGVGVLPGVWPRNGGERIAPINFIDAIVAMPASNFGLRLSLGVNTTGQSQKVGDNTTEIDNTTFVANIVASYKLEGETPIDISAELGYASQDYELTPPDGDPTTDTSTNLPSVSILARGYSPMAKGVELGFLALVDFRSGSDEQVVAGGDPTGSSNTTITALVGAGPVYTVEDKFTISAYAALGIGYDSEDPQTNADAEDDQNSTLSLLLPQLKLSGEFYVTDWLVLRTGAEYTWALASTTDEAGDPDNETTVTATVYGFRWISGIGLDFGDLEINGVLDPTFLMNGPNFIGGSTSTFVLLNLSYNFN